jgi:hypothetical protein
MIVKNSTNEKKVFKVQLEVIVGFVDIGGILDYHCLNFLFIGGILDYHCLNKKV